MKGLNNSRGFAKSEVHTVYLEAVATMHMKAEIVADRIQRDGVGASVLKPLAEYRKAQLTAWALGEVWDQMPAPEGELAAAEIIAASKAVHDA